MREDSVVPPVVIVPPTPTLSSLCHCWLNRHRRPDHRDDGHRQVLGRVHDQCHRQQRLEFAEHGGGLGVVTGLAAGATNITATYQGVGSPAASVQVTAAPAAPVQAAFTVTPTFATDGNPGQSPVSPEPPSNTLRCTFDARPSQPATGITSYTWEIPAGSQNIFRTATVAEPNLKCGDLSTIDAGGTRDVKLTITTATGSSSVTQAVTFAKGKPC